MFCPQGRLLRKERVSTTKIAFLGIRQHSVVAARWRITAHSQVTSDSMFRSGQTQLSVLSYPVLSIVRPLADAIDNVVGFAVRIAQELVLNGQHEWRVLGKPH